jgi:hypothetical protein
VNEDDVDRPLEGSDPAVESLPLPLAGIAVFSPFGSGGIPTTSTSRSSGNTIRSCNNSAPSEKSSAATTRSDNAPHGSGNPSGGPRWGNPVMRAAAAFAYETFSSESTAITP